MRTTRRCSYSVHRYRTRRRKRLRKAISLPDSLSTWRCPAARPGGLSRIINFAFFGGLSEEVEKRTKVKSRVVANALSQLIRDSSQVLVMGHKNSDMDAIGAAAGMVCAARVKGRPVHIVVDRQHTMQVI